MNDKRREAIKLIKDLKKKKHSIKSRQYIFECHGVQWNYWEEASDPRGAIKALKLIFQIDDGEIKVEEQ